MLYDYNDTIDYLYHKLPMFSRVGAAAIKNDLHNTLAICEAIGNPQHKFKTIHIAGTNGKGSSSHMIASILQAAGYKVGLYTSPHLKDFRERIRINGQMIPQQNVIDAVNEYIPLIERIEPSFFEITVAMAFQFFAKEKVDIAVIETGLGGRLDSTNIIKPEACLITNIGYDHQALLGNTLEAIASEKAGIIKENIPVVISELQPEIKHVFEQKAMSTNAPFAFASQHWSANNKGDLIELVNKTTNLSLTYKLDLKGIYQLHNIKGVLCIINILQQKGWQIAERHIVTGLGQVQTSTGLRGRWEILHTTPLTVADVAHNVNGMEQLLLQVNNTLVNNNIKHLHIVIGMVKDKDINSVLQLLPTSATYYFTQAQIPRALPAVALKAAANTLDLNGEHYNDVNTALNAAQQNATGKDMILICGSVFVIGELNTIAL